MSGVVTSAEMNVGDVLEPGKPVVEITKHRGFFFETYVNHKAIADISLGMKVKIKVEAFDFQKFGTLDGAIEFIAPDSTPIEGHPGVYYLVRVSVDGESLGRGELTGPIKLGMEGRAEIVTGDEDGFGLGIQENPAKRESGIVHHRLPLRSTCQFGTIADRPAAHGGEPLMAKPQKPINHYTVYLAVRLVVCILQALSLAKSQAFARFLAWIAYRIDRRHRKVGQENLRNAFPAASNAAIDRHVRCVYEHFCTVFVEMVQIPRRLHVSNWRRRMELIHGGRVVGGLTKGRAMLIVTGHFGNWEMAGYALGMFGFRTYAVARRIDNPHLDKFLARFRSGTGQTILDKNTDYDRIQQVLREGGAIAMLCDQDAGQRGMFVDFFGRPASTFKSIALLSTNTTRPWWWSACQRWASRCVIKWFPKK